MIARLILFCLAATWLHAASSAPAPLILISLDGFRWDYSDLHPGESATLRRLKREGTSARELIPVFPTNTFPNHYSIVTGLYPVNHGIVNNDFFDVERGKFFKFNQAGGAHDPHWWGGEPIWVTAIKQGHKAAASFWVGSEAEIRGVRPTFWRPYDGRLPFETRLEELVKWMRLPVAERPALITFYLEEVNGAGHRHGPNSPELVAAIKFVDTCIATILARLAAEGIEPNLVIVSDHGMVATDLKRVVVLEDYIERATVQIEADGSGVALRPNDGNMEGLVRALQKIPHAKTYRAEDLPAHLHLKPSPRVAPVWVLPEEGWHVATRATFDRLRTRYAATGYLQGDHGYDPNLSSMRGIFIAHGPAFRRGAEIAAVENIHVYNLLCAVLKLKPARNDGDDRLVRTVLNP
jgi:predicted AlkP superfamily pyrophosphatase or phosphodiesterase